MYFSATARTCDFFTLDKTYILKMEDGCYQVCVALRFKWNRVNSEDGAIWLSLSMLSPYKYFFSVLDVDVICFLKTLAFLSVDEIKILEDQMSKPGNVTNSTQIKHVEKVTQFVHKEEGLKEAIKAAEALRPGAETKLDWNLIVRIAEYIPSCSLPIDRVLGYSIVDVSVSAGLFESRAAVRRLLKQGELYMNNKRVNENNRVEEEDIVEGRSCSYLRLKKRSCSFCRQDLERKHSHINHSNIPYDFGNLILFCYYG